MMHCASGIAVICIILAYGEANASPLAFSVEPDDLTFDVNSTASKAIFRCTAIGDPTPKISWRRNDETISESIQYHVTEQYDLEVMNPNVTNDNDIYQCIARNSIGTVMSRFATLEIAYIESFSGERPSDVSANANEGICISCNAPSAYPGIRTIWRKVEGTRIDHSGRTRTMSDGRLCFSYTKLTDGGTYDCSAANSHDMPGYPLEYLQSLGSFTFTINDGDYANQILMVTTDIPYNVTVKRGQTAILECFFLGGPTPTLTWSRVGSGLPVNSSPQDYNQELWITNVQPSDGGEYTCTAISNGNNEGTMKQYLIVTSPPVLTTELIDVSVSSGNSVSFNCDVEPGDEDVEYSWYFNTLQIEKDNRFDDTPSNVLSLKKTVSTDSGMYQCVASNQYGSVVSTARLIVCSSDFCTAEYVPACGSDGQTYSNMCKFKQGVCDKPGLTVSHNGQCGTDGSVSNLSMVTASIIVVMTTAIQLFIQLV